MNFPIYIVQLRANLDDPVVGVFEDKSEATGFAEQVRNRPQRFSKLFDVYGKASTSGLIAVTVYEWRSKRPHKTTKRKTAKRKTPETPVVVYHESIHHDT